MTKKRILSKIILSALILLFFNFNVLPYVRLNGGDEGYDENGGESFVYGSSIKYFIMKGGGYYLDGYSGILKLLERIELSDVNGLDYAQLNQIIDSALDNMNNAHYYYLLLIMKAEVTPYNMTFIDKLKAFDYDGFESEHHLNGVVFARVEGYLKEGDITGTFKACRIDIVEIIAVLERIKGYASNNRMPVLKDIWLINELCSESLLFGQYAARVFAEIKNH
jgi:hypothetical protein